MNLKPVISHLKAVLEDNPAIIVLAGCGLAAVIFISLIVVPDFWRKLKRRRREKKRSAQKVSPGNLLT